MPTISVVIPTYNRKQLLTRALQSVLKQSFQDFEMIVVDDASTDGTEILINSFEDQRIIYLRHNNNQGVSAARNSGIKHASGEFIAFLDSDDEWLPEKLLKQLNVFENTSKTVGVVYTAVFEVYANVQPEWPKRRGNIFNYIVVKNFIGTASNPMVRKECFSNVGLFDETLPIGEDWDMWIRLAEKYEIDFVEEILVRYYMQGDSLSNNKNVSIKGLKRISKKHEPHIKNIPKELRAERYFKIGKTYWYVRGFIYCFFYFIKATLASFSIIPTIFDFLIIRNFRKLL